MCEEKESIIKNSLTAGELLRNKGLSSTVWTEWENSLRPLPKTGKKQFEPNGSLLQNLQIENGLKKRKDLLGIERVERICNLASAEWMPAQKKARVTKKSGQDWGVFGHEISCTLYLFPEEALLLLEMNCLELVWNGTPLSLQQAYDILLDESTCTLEEYRVYSQLTRCGYRMQRFVYKGAERSTRADEFQKRKVIVDPVNGLRMDTSRTRTTESANTSIRDNSEAEITTTDQTIGQEVQSVMTNILQNLETEEKDADNQSDARTNTYESADGLQKRNNKKGKNSKVEIISEETLVGGIKIVKEPAAGISKTAVPATRWPGTRISRNVKVLPRRTDKPAHSAATLQSSSTDTVESTSEQTEEKSTTKRKIAVGDNITESKRSKQEVIELSDEEIEEVPLPMTRMEMLNLLPDIAKRSIITEKIARRYIPCTIKPQKSVYRYERSKLLGRKGQDKGQYSNARVNSDAVHSGKHLEQNRLVPYHNQNVHTNICNPNVYGIGRRPFPDINCLLYNNRLPLGFHHNIYWQERIYQQSIFQNMLNYIAFQNIQSTFQHNRCLSIQMNNFSNTSIVQRNCSMQNRFQQNVYHNVSLQDRFYQRRVSFNVPNGQERARYSSPHTSRQHPNRNQFPDGDSFSKPSFTKHPGMSSWQELKERWREDKTITIDDQDSGEKGSVDCNEVEVVQHCISPLVGPKNAGSLAEIYDRLQIIKSAPEKVVRRKRSSYKISYNVYSSSQHYRKSNPGEPLCRIVVIRQSGNLFMQPIELSRLQQDATGVPVILAYVSTSISYIQPGIVSIPDLTQHR